MGDYTISSMRTTLSDSCCHFRLPKVQKEKCQQLDSAWLGRWRAGRNSGEARRIQNESDRS